MKHYVLALATVLTLAACSADQDRTDGALNLADYQGRWLVINYWAEWCKPCIKEIPELNALDAKYPQVAVLGVNFDGVTGDALQAQMTALGIAFPVLEQDPSGVLGVPLPSVLPATIILDPKGHLVHNQVGPQKLESQALDTGQVGIIEEEGEGEAGELGVE